MLGLDGLVVVLVGERLGGLATASCAFTVSLSSLIRLLRPLFLSSWKSSFSRGLSPAGIVNCTFTYWSPGRPPWCGTPYPGKPERAPARRLGRNLHRHLTLEGRRGDLGPEGGVGSGHRQVRVEVVPLALEARVGVTVI